MFPGLKKAAAAILQAESIVISCHVNPDGDCIGSMLALGRGLKNIGKKVFLLSQDGVPERYRSLPGAGEVRRRGDEKVDLAIAVDCNDRHMLGKSFEAFERAKKILEIDHHEFRVPFGDIALIDTKAGAVGEIIFGLMKELKISFNQDIAQNILTSIIVETNSFSLPNVRVFTFKICAELLDTNLDFVKLTEMVYWMKTREQVLLSGICLSGGKFLKGRRIVWSEVKGSDFRKVGGKDEDVDAVADEMRKIKEVRIVVLFRQREKGLLRISLRSKGRINVAGLAQLFGGGGHYDVAGCTIADKAELRRKVIKEAEKLLK